MIKIDFVSKKDGWYASLMWGTIVLSFCAEIAPAIYVTIFWMLPGLLGTGFLLWLWFGTGYQIKDDVVQIQHGPFKETIEIQKIKKSLKGKMCGLRLL